MSITKTFKDFFSEKFVETRPFKKLYEMAIRHDIAKLPVNIDKDDIEFLQQFPHEFWKEALKMRYDMLFDAVEKLHKDRREIHKHDEIKNNILQAMEDGNWQHLTGIVPDNEIYHLKKVANDLDEREKDVEADKLAHEYVKTKTPHINEPKDEVPFTIKWHKATKTILAKPFLNRLYHKLERTKGEAHIPGSGLEGETGRYGYDMAYPHRKGKYAKINDEGEEEGEYEIPHRTEGMRFPTDAAIENRLADFFNINMHRILGDLPEDAVWVKTSHKDRWSAGYLENELRKQIESRLRIGGTYEDNSELRADAAKMAKEEIIKMAKEGKLKGPPIPGKFPEGQPISVEEKNGKEILTKPDLYLPHEMKTIKTPEGTEHKLVPIVNPAHFFRELGSNPKDFAYEIGPDGKERQKFDDEGKPIYTVPQEKLRGYQKQFVHVGDDEYVDDGRQKAAGALDFNHDSEGKKHITKGDPGWQEAYDRVFGEQELGNISKGKNPKFIPSKSGSYYKDVVEGVLWCYTRQGCVGTTSHEKSILLQNIEDLHQIVVQKMLLNLRDENLYTEKGRKNFAFGKVSNVMQKDQERGGGTRRLRKLTQAARTASLDATTAGKEGGEVSISDKISMGIKDKGKLGVGDSGPTYLSGKRGKGNRIQDTGGQKTPYSLETMKETLVLLRKDAQEADEESQKAIRLSQKATGEEIINMLQKGINDKADVAYYIEDLLTKLYEQSGNKKGKQAAGAQIRAWIEDGASSSEKLLAQFENHPLVQQAVGVANPDIQQFPGQAQAGNRQGPQEDEQESNGLMNQDLEQLNDKLNNQLFNNPKYKQAFEPMPGEKYSAYLIKNWEKFRIPNNENKDRIMDSLQRSLNQKFGVEGQPATASAAKDIELPKKPIQKPEEQGEHPLTVGPYHKYEMAEDWLKLAHHMSYLQRFPQEIPNLEKNIQDMYAQGKINQWQYNSAMKHINNHKKEQ